VHLREEPLPPKRQKKAGSKDSERESDPKPAKKAHP